MKNIIIAIDGNSGCGKSTTAKAVAKILKYIYIDTGAMYRAVTLYFIRNNIDLKDEKQVTNALEHIHISFKYDPEQGLNVTYLNGENVEAEIRGMEVSNWVSPVSSISLVRRKMVEQQRELGKGKGVVMDGRDITTVVFPDADLKIFMKADLDVRAGRRKKELKEKGKDVGMHDVVKNLEDRDRIDSSRADSPLKKADGAYEIDTSHLTFDEQVKKVLDLAGTIING
jgi:cytidylate kinase